MKRVLVLVLGLVLAGCEGSKETYVGLAAFADESTIVAVDGDGVAKRFEAPFEDGGERLFRITNDASPWAVFGSADGSRILAGIPPERIAPYSPFRDATEDGTAIVLDLGYEAVPEIVAAFAPDGTPYAWTFGRFGSASSAGYEAFWIGGASASDWNAALVSTSGELSGGPASAFVVTSAGVPVLDRDGLVGTVVNGAWVPFAPRLFEENEHIVADGVVGSAGDAVFFHAREVGADEALEVVRVANTGTAWTASLIATIPGDPVRPSWNLFHPRLAAARGDAVAVTTFECAEGQGCDGVVRWLEEEGGGWTVETVALIEDEVTASQGLDAIGSYVLTGADVLTLHERGASGWTSREIGRVGADAVIAGCATGGGGGSVPIAAALFAALLVLVRRRV